MITFETRAEMMATLPPSARIAEIGVFAGEFSEEILRRCSPRSLHLVDMWDGSHSSGDKDGRNSVTINDMHGTYLRLCQRYKDHGSVRLIKSASVTFFAVWAEDFFDAVYIDADHSYDGVLADLRGAARVTRTGGFLLGHDYHGDVARAVATFCGETGQSVIGVASDRCPSFMIRLRK